MGLLEFDVKYVGEIRKRDAWNPDGWECVEYAVTLTYNDDAGTRMMKTPYYCGMLFRRVPNIVDVLDNLTSGAGMVDNARDEWEFFEESGIDGSREAHEMWTQCVAERDKLRALFGADYDAALEGPQGFGWDDAFPRDEIPTRVAIG